MLNNKEVGNLNAWFEERGYGFVLILCPDGVRRYFLHRSNILSGTPVKGAVIRFEPLSQPKGVIATKAEIFSNRQEMERHDAAVALAAAAQTAQKTSDKAVS